MEQKDFLIQEMNFTKTTEHTFSSGQYYQILLLSKGECYFEFENNFVYCNTETAIFLKPELPHRQLRKLQALLAEGHGNGFHNVVQLSLSHSGKLHLGLLRQLCQSPGFLPGL